jgi:hypothetical protein
MTGAEFKALIPDTGKVYVDGFPIEPDDVEIDQDGDVLIASPEADEFEDGEEQDDEEPDNDDEDEDDDE